MTDLLTDLKAVRALLTPPEHFLVGYYAATHQSYDFLRDNGDEDDNEPQAVDVCSPKAKCWCLTGAIERVARDGRLDVSAFNYDDEPTDYVRRYDSLELAIKDTISPEDEDRLRAYLNLKLPETSGFSRAEAHHLPNYNDLLGHKWVLDLLDRAITARA